MINAIRNVPETYLKLPLEPYKSNINLDVLTRPGLGQNGSMVA